KGITDRVTLNGMTLMNWEIYNLPEKDDYVVALTNSAVVGAASDGSSKGGIFFKGSFGLDSTADTYFDMSGFKKGVVWVNGHNLGRYWYVGPQQRLYCPASWLKKGKNTMVVLDMHQHEAAAVKGRRTL